MALSVRDENTLERELRPLQAIKDHYPKVILTMDDDNSTFRRFIAVTDSYILSLKGGYQYGF